MRSIFIATLVVLGVLGCGSEDPIAPAPEGDSPTWDVSYADDTRAPFFLTGIWGTSDVNVYAVGSDATIMRFDGADWRVLDPTAVHPLTVFWDIDGTSPGDIWVTGSLGTVLHFNGADWQDSKVQGAGSLFSLWPLSANEVYAGSEDGKVFRYNGTFWTEFADIGIQNVIDIWGTATNDIWAVTIPEVFHYDGNEWVKVIDDNRYEFDAVRGRDDHVVLAGWSGDARTGNGTIFSYDQDGLVAMPIADPTPGFIGFDALEGSQFGTLWAGGANGKMFRLDPNASVWVYEDTGVDFSMQALWVSPSGRAYAVGGRTGIIHTVIPTGNN